MSKTFNFLRKQFAFIGAGITDRISSRCTGTKCNFAKTLAIKLSDCEPWSDHFEETTIIGLNNAMLKQDYSTMRILAAWGTREDANKFCINLAETAILLLSSGSEEVCEISFFSE
jgi:hypothetical protein